MDNSWKTWTINGAISHSWLWPINDHSPWITRLSGLQIMAYIAKKMMNQWDGDEWIVNSLALRSRNGPNVYRNPVIGGRHLWSHGIPWHPSHPSPDGHQMDWGGRLSAHQLQPEAGVPCELRFAWRQKLFEHQFATRVTRVSINLWEKYRFDPLVI